MSGNAAVTYGYAPASIGNRLTNITSNTASYNFLYDKWANLQSVNIGGSQTLVSNNYADGNGNLVQSVYGNGYSTEYVYDQYDRMIAVKSGSPGDEETTQTAAYTYNADGQLARVHDLLNGHVTSYAYDLSERVTEYATGQGRIFYGYDNLDRNSKVTTEFNGIQSAATYSYLSANRPGVTNLEVGKVDRTFDSLQRESVHQIYPNANEADHLRSETTYLDLKGNHTTGMVSEYANYTAASTDDKTTVKGYTRFSYIYDENGNISKITEHNGNKTRTRTYEYDSLNQLIRENDKVQGKSITYTYDHGGNRLSKSEYAYTTGELGAPVDTITYSYGDEAWKDKLTIYNEQNITYDEIGNPLTYRDGMTFAWTQGRRLAGTTLSDGTTVGYQYNTNGIRIGKTVSGIETIYFVDASGMIQALKQGEETLIFQYDSTGRREGFIWYTGIVKNGAYYYLYNAQSDVIGIVGSDLISVVSYEYDSWGKLLNVSGTKARTVGQLNPFRYRGYYYDTETGLYYLESRYYDPEVGRFINADNVSLVVASPMALINKNLYAYCDNNPIIRVDSSGEFWFTIAGAAVGAVLGATSKMTSNLITGNEVFDGVIGAAVGGAVYGGIATSPLLRTTLGVHINAIASYTSAAAESITNEAVSYIQGKKITAANIKRSVTKVAKDTVVEGTQTYVAGRIAGNTVKTNRGWIRPKKFLSSFFGKYARKTWRQSAVQAVSTMISSTIRGWWNRLCGK